MRSVGVVLLTVAVVLFVASASAIHGGSGGWPLPMAFGLAFTAGGAALAFSGREGQK